METRCRHALYLPDHTPGSAQIVIEGDEAKHAVRVKRVKPGQHVAILDGRGGRTVTEVVDANRTLTLKPITEERLAPSTPRIEVYSATPKGPRAGTLIDLLSQTGADSWSHLDTAFGTESVSSTRRERLERVAVESLKQCGRPWLLEIGSETTIAEAVEVTSNTDIIIADASGEPYTPLSDTTNIRILIGSEGGWREDELDSAIAAGARPCSFGPHVMRIETAAAVATAIIRNAWNRTQSACVQ